MLLGKGKVEFYTMQQKFKHKYKIRSIFNYLCLQARHINKMKERQWAYYDEIAKAANVPSFAPVVKKIYDHTNEMRLLNFATYKNYQYRIIDKDNFAASYCKPC